MYDDELKFVGFILAGTVIFIGLVIWMVTLGTEYQCHAKWDTSGRPVKWELFSGCQVNDGKGWLPADNYRSF